MVVPGSSGTPGDSPAPGSPCRDCGSPTSEDQRYCLACGARVGERRLEPLAVLATRREALAAAVAGDDAPSSTGPAPRAVPFAAAAAAILVAGVSGMLVTGTGGSGARAAIVLPASAPPAAAAPAVVAPTSSDRGNDSGDETAGDDAVAEDPPATDETPDTTPAVADEDPPADAPNTDAGDDAPAEDPGDSGADPAPTAPRVWLLALEGPRAQEAIDRVAAQGVRLTGLSALGADALTNATALVSGARPVTVPAAPATGTPAPSIPEQLLSGKRKWRAYVDSLATGQPAPAGACAAAPAGDVAAAALAARLPFGRIAALQQGDRCSGAVTSLEALGNDLSAGDDIPAFSYAALGGCAPADRSAVALPDELEDAVSTITSSTEYQERGTLIVTTVGATDPCGTGPAAPVDPAAPPVDPAAPATAPPLAPTVILRADLRPGATLATPLDPLALARAAAEALELSAPGDAAAESVPAITLPKAKQR